MPINKYRNKKISDYYSASSTMISIGKLNFAGWNEKHR